MKALTPYVPGKMKHLTNFVISIFDHQIIFDKYVNAMIGYTDLMVQQSELSEYNNLTI